MTITKWMVGTRRIEPSDLPSPQDAAFSFVPPHFCHQKARRLETTVYKTDRPTGSLASLIRSAVLPINKHLPSQHLNGFFLSRHKKHIFSLITLINEILEWFAGIVGVVPINRDTSSIVYIFL